MGHSDHDKDFPLSEKTNLLSNSGESDRSVNEQLSQRQSRSRSRSQSRSRSRIGSYSRSSSGTLARSTSITISHEAHLVSSSEVTKVPSLWSSSKSQLVILAALFFADVISSMCFAIMAPFFPQDAEKKGMSLTVSGWVFGIYSLIQFAFAPVVGMLIPVVGSWFLLLSGMFFGGGCTVLFGVIDRVPITKDNNWTFTIFCFVLRIFLALGDTATLIGSFAIATSTFPNDPSTVLGVLEIGEGVGLMLGPTLGGALYEAGGFIAPFAAVGGAMILSVLLLYFILPKDNGNSRKEDPGSMLALLKIPVIDLILVTNVVSALLWVGLDQVLEPNLRQFNLSPSVVGLVFLLISGPYAIFAPISGLIADRMDNSTPLMIIGFAVLTVGFLLLGPSELIGLGSYKELWLNLVSLCIIGVGISLTTVPTYDKILTSAEKAGIPKSMGTHGAVASLWTSVNALGEFIGPTLLGATYDTIGFSWSMTLIATMTFSMFLLTICIYMYENDTCCRRSSKKQYSPIASRNIEKPSNDL